MDGHEPVILDQEVSIMKHLDHPGIIKCLNYGANEEITRMLDGTVNTCCYLALELAAGGELFAYL